MRAEPGRVLPFWTLAGGFAFEREEMKNTYVDATATRTVSCCAATTKASIWITTSRSSRKLFLNVGLREEIYQTPFVPGDANDYPPRARLSGARLIPG